MGERNRRPAIKVPSGGRRVRRNEVEALLALARDPDGRVRARAVQTLCPCHVRTDIPAVWDRIFERAGDEEVRVRRQVLHACGDGSPREREAEAVAVVETLARDPDVRLRRQARRVLAAYRRTGRINVL